MPLPAFPDLLTSGDATLLAYRTSTSPDFCRLGPMRPTRHIFLLFLLISPGHFFRFSVCWTGCFTRGVGCVRCLSTGLSHLNTRLSACGLPLRQELTANEMEGTDVVINKPLPLASAGFRETDRWITSLTATGPVSSLHLPYPLNFPSPTFLVLLGCRWIWIGGHLFPCCAVTFQDSFFPRLASNGLL